MPLFLHFSIFQKHPSNPLQNYYPLKSIPLHLSCSLLPKAPSSDRFIVHIKNKDMGRAEESREQATPFTFAPRSFLLHWKINCCLSWQGRLSGRVTLQKKPSRNSSSPADEVTERSPPFAPVPQWPAWLLGELVGKRWLGRRDQLWLGSTKTRVSWRRIAPALCLELQDASATEAREILLKGNSDQMH